MIRAAGAISASGTIAASSNIFASGKESRVILVGRDARGSRGVEVARRLDGPEREKAARDRGESLLVEADRRNTLAAVLAEERGQ